MAPANDRNRARPSAKRSGPLKRTGPGSRTGPPKRSGPAKRTAGPPQRGRSGSAERGGKSAAQRRRPEEDRNPEIRRKGWGSVARKGAGRVAPREGTSDTASAAWRKAVQEARDTGKGTDFEPEEWVDVDDEAFRAEAFRAEASHAVDRGRRPSRRPPEPAPLADHRGDLSKAMAPQQVAKAEKALKDAARAFERERYQDARSILAPVAVRAPAVPAVRELLGLAYYRLGRWKQAIKELEAFRTLTDSTEQHPVLADAYRALERWDRVDELWDELRQASPSGELVTEGRIVAAGAHADQGHLREAISLLGKGWQLPKRPKAHHLRRAYALADLHERAGDVPHARDLFARIQRVDAGFADVGDRLHSLA